MQSSVHASLTHEKRAPQFLSRAFVLIEVGAVLLVLTLGIMLLLQIVLQPQSDLFRHMVDVRTQILFDFMARDMLPSARHLIGALLRSNG